MIFFAVAAPTPGSASRSFCDAVFRSTGALEAAPLLPDEALDDDEDADRAGALVAAGPAAGGGADSFADSFFEERPAFTRPEILSIVAWGTPAFERSATEE